MHVAIGFRLHIFKTDAAFLELNHFSLLYNMSTTNSAQQDVNEALEDLSNALESPSNAPEKYIHTAPEFFALLS